MSFINEELEKMAALVNEDKCEEGCIRAISQIKNILTELDYADDGNGPELLYEDTFLYAMKMAKTNNDNNKGDNRDENKDDKITIYVCGPCADRTNIQSDNSIDVVVISESVIQLPERGEALTSDNYCLLKNNRSLCLRKELGEKIENPLTNEKPGWNDWMISFIEMNSNMRVNVFTAQRYCDSVKDGGRNPDEESGAAIFADVSNYVLCYPEQYLRNGIEKERKTNENYKRYVRLIKNMREKMTESGYTISPCVCDAGLESILWNADDSLFSNSEKLQDGFKSILNHLSNAFDDWKDYTWVDGITRLFQNHETMELYRDFLAAMTEFIDIVYSE